MEYHRHGQAAHATRRRSGMIFVMAMWTILILCAIALIFAREMRVEVTASANRVAAGQATTIELGAEQYVLAAVDGSNGDAVSVLQTPAEQIYVPGTVDKQGNPSGDGYFWILQYYPDDDVTPAFGITDETSKLNLNVATSTALAQLPQMTQDIADSIVVWRSGATTGTSGQGADSSVYQGLPRPYSAKAAPFESVDELYLIRNVTDTLLYSYDLDRNGVLDQNEQSVGGLASAFNSANGSGRGIFPFVSVWGKEPNTDPDGNPRVNISQLTSPTQLRTLLTKYLPGARGTQILERAMMTRNFKSIFDFATKTGMKQSELELVADYLTTSTAKTLPGLINVNTAPVQVLMCLPGIEESDAEQIVAQRGQNASDGIGAGGTTTGGSSASGANTDYTWILNALNPPTKAAALGSLITGRSFFFSADIVAVSGNGRSFKRARIVVDARSSPPVIVYRKDLSYLGWPLDPAILAHLKNPTVNGPLPGPSGYGTGGANGLSSGLSQ
jgi:type II secretory pathway component PulK